MKEWDTAEPESAEGLEAQGGGEPHVVQVGHIGEFLAGVTVKEEPAEELQETWEMQWQEVLRTLQSPNLGWKDPKLPRSPDTKAFQAPFKAGADANWWSVGERATQHLPSLAGEAPGTHGSQGASVRVKDEMPDEDAIRLELWCRRFRQFRYREAEGPREVCKQLWRLCHQWLKPERRTKEQVLELVILEQFLTVLPQKMQDWVRDRGPETCAQAVALAEGFLQRQSGKVLEPKLEQDPSGMVQMQFCLEAEEGDGEAGLLGNGHKKPLSPKGLVPKDRAISLEKVQGETLQVLETPESVQGAESCPRKTPKETTLSIEGDRGLRDITSQDGMCEGKREKPDADDKKNLSWNGGILEDQRTLLGRKIYSCKYCWEHFREKTHLIKHERTHTGANPHECAECGGSFHSSLHLASHKRIHTSEKPYQCSQCKGSFSQKSRLVSHQRIHTGEKPYKCSQCGLSLSRRCHLLRHEQTHTGEKPYKCLECGKSFAQKTNLITHERTHTGEKPYKCLRCGKDFGEKASLNRHERMHLGERPYKCSECAKSFFCSSDLRKHKVGHMGEKPYKCSHCRKGFCQKSSLAVHEKAVHTREEQYKCSHCGKLLSRRCHLTRHERIHTGEKPHQCIDCDKSFSQKANLIKHQRTHTGEKPYQCSTCEKRFIEKASLIRHERTHTGEKPYECSECGKRFISKSDLGKHKRKKHCQKESP
ncbi:zinc finger protein ZFP2-like [Rhineura floridana]|uniref:zinc finger protein ZFP2-like n=1 Tax=Rhineura floridana TaxID=261503 RepID=UPI002AC82B4B|nr:zinc finger protein ZFP2-like [Rhineura floridana]XP_061475627.1 zinc finger protein ZFP2-like [Rhineura floridana]XP_061475628.1 zinc finger protein ZFP2-like [Rhineura floridana]